MYNDIQLGVGFGAGVKCEEYGENMVHNNVGSMLKGGVCIKYCFCVLYISNHLYIDFYYQCMEGVGKRDNIFFSIFWKRHN